VAGHRRNPTNEPRWFTTAYFHHPDDLRAEANAVGLKALALLGVEGPAGWIGNFTQLWSTPEGRGAILFAAKAVESEGALYGLSAHLLMVTRVPG
jgi:hypothetical protein